MEGVEGGSMLGVPFGRQRLLGVVVGLAEHSDVPPERLVEPLKALGRGVPAELVRLGLWVAEEYCSTPARGLALVLPPGTGTGKATRRVGAKHALTAAITEAGRSALAEARLGTAQRRVLELLATAPRSAAEACREAGCTHDTLRRLEARGFVTLDDVRVRRAPASHAIGARGDADAALTAAQAVAV